MSQGRGLVLAGQMGRAQRGNQGSKAQEDFPLKKKSPKQRKIKKTIPCSPRTQRRVHLTKENERIFERHKARMIRSIRQKESVLSY